MATAIQPITGRYELDSSHSTVQFAVKHVGVSIFRGSFAEVEARLATADGRTSLDGQAAVESISIGEPQEFRDHVVWGSDFFNAASHPAIGFRSTSVEFGDDGSATVTGELTIVGVTVWIAAHGAFEGPKEDPFGASRFGLDLRATIDRRKWGIDWQTPLPDGGDALGWDVEISAQLEFVRQP
jgi:polyisoprenoid-binding protein YceI